MSNTDIFDTFIAAKQALDELPAARAELAQARSDHEALKKESLELLEEIIDKDKIIAKLKATLANTEVELASATFRDKQSQETLDSLRGLLGIHVGSVSSDNAPLSEASVTQAQPSTVTEPADIATGSTYEPVNHERPIMVDSDGKTQGISDTQLNPTPQSPYAADSIVGDAGHYPEGDRESAGPTVATEQTSALHTDSQSSGASSGTAWQQETAGAIESKPYADRRYWQKPSDLTWSQWINGGGQKPHWMTGKEINPDMLDF